MTRMVANKLHGGRLLIPHNITSTMADLAEKKYGYYRDNTALAVKFVLAVPLEN